MINQPTLKRLLFPLGRYTKDQIRDKANQLGLLNANRPDSQEICLYRKKVTDHLLKIGWNPPIYAPVVFNILMARCLVNIKASITTPSANERA